MFPLIVLAFLSETAEVASKIEPWGLPEVSVET